jgi:integrase
MFNQARTIGWEKGNPCQGVSKFAEQSRERFLSAEELQRFMTALEAEPVQAWKDVFKLCLFTGARRSNVMSMRWEELDLAAGRWTIPAAKFKNGQASTVHLSPQAVQILTDRRNESEWVFPSTTSKTDHLVNPAKRWDALCKRAKLADLHIHDLRRTLGSWQAAGGSSLQVIGKSLGHRSLAATAVYSRLDLDPVKVSVNAATAAMMAAAAKKPADEPHEQSIARTSDS